MAWPMRTFYAIQQMQAGSWVTTQLFIVEEFAVKKVAKLGAGWRVEPVQREMLD